MIEIGQRINKLREERNLSTNKLANLAGISQAYLRQVELGETCPTVEMLLYIIEAMNVSVFEFFDVDNSLNHQNIAFMEMFKKLNDDEKTFVLKFINLFLDYKNDALKND